MMRTIERDGLERLLGILHTQGYQTIGPTVRSGAIVLDEILTIADLPVGWTDTQGPARYRISRADDDALFAYVVGPQSWKKFLFPPELRILIATRHNGSFTVTDDPDGDAKVRRAFIGVRPCELASIVVQDKVFLGGPYRDPHYESERRNLFIVAVNCTKPGGTCFCTSMQTGPAATSGYDLCLTEVREDGRHYFVVVVGTEAGHALLESLPSRESSEVELATVRARIDRASAAMTRSLDLEGLPQALRGNLDHPRWEDVAGRCLSCTNCTQVCPTCFCSTIEDTTDLSGTTARRTRKWDSCFTLDFSYIHGGSVRTSVKSRYRQWLLHKLANWVDQFGMMGCVGCGRCITWCPVGIDITEEANAIRHRHAVSPLPSGE